MATVCALVALRVKSLVRLDCFLPVLLNNNRNQLIRNFSITRYYCTPDNVAKGEHLNDTNVSEKPEKKVEDIKITLLLPDNSIMVTNLENANKISKRRDLVLIKVNEAESKSIRPTYKLVNQTDHLKEELGDDEKETEIVLKSVKTLQVSSKITLHDLHTKLKHIIKLLEKKHKVKVILANGSTTQEKIIKTIETSVKNYGTIQKNIRPSSTIFTITPNLNKLGNNKLDNVDQ